MEQVDITLEVQIGAPRNVVWKALTTDMAAWMGVGDENHPPMNLRLEPHVGGRWFRDLSDTLPDGSGHLWGHVQVIKPPYLLELTGPMVVSAPAMNHIAFRLEQEGESTRVKFTHRGVGLIPPEFVSGFNEGWTTMLKGLKNHVEH